MADVDTRYVLFAIWGGGSVLVYGRVLYLRIRSYLIHHDGRARRELLAAAALFLVALGCGISVAFLLFGVSGTPVRQTAVSIALGAFLAAGIIMATERRPRDRGRRSGD